MKKRVFVIHGWGASPKSEWFPWLKKELEKNNFDAFVLEMPNTEEPKIEEWVSFLSNQVGEPDENTYFVGHSIGCQAVMRYLEKFDDIKIGGIIFVASWFNLVNLDSEEEEEIAKPWLETPINLEKVKNSSQKIVAIFSDNDPFVELKNKNVFEKELDAEIIIERNKGHFSDDDDITELPIVLEKILEMSK